MADAATKDVHEPAATTTTVESTPEKHAHSDVHHDAEVAGVAARPTGWMYKRWKLGPLKLSWYASPMTQLVLVAFVCFLCPGMFNAINGIGAGGQVDPTVANQANIALYCTFCVVGFFAGTIVNRMGVKLTLSFGGIGYCIYVASFLAYNHTQNAGFNIFAGALLGVCAGLLWAAQGAIMMSYPNERNKGKYISVFWMIFNLGAVIGSLIPLGQNINNSGGTVTDGTYVGFMILMIVGAALAWSLVDAKHVVRNDGSRVILMMHPTWKSEILGMGEVFKTDWYILLLFPMFFSSNYFYTYHFQDVNTPYFTLRTRSLNGVLYWISQIIGAGVFGFALDTPMLRRPTRAKAALAALFVITFVIWGGGYAFQLRYTRAPDPTKVPESSKMDWTTPGYVGPMFLYMFYGFFDAAWQTSVYWFMGSLSNNSRKLANFAGFYKGIQSAGAVIAPAVDTLLPPYMNELAANWGLLAGSLIIAAPVIFTKVRDTVPIEEDLRFSDETIEDVKGLTFGPHLAGEARHDLVSKEIGTEPVATTTAGELGTTTSAHHEVGGGNTQELAGHETTQELAGNTTSEKI